MRQSVTAAAGILGLLLLGVGHSRAADDEATIAVSRYGSSGPSGHAIFINGHKLGTVDTGDTVRFKFTPNKDGTNYLVIKRYDALLGYTMDKWNSTATFTAGKGAEAKASFQLLYGSKVDVTVLDKGQIEGEVRLPQKHDQEVTVKKESVKAKEPVKVTIDDEIIEKEVYSEPIEIEEGVSFEYTVERTYERTMTASTTVGAELDTKATGTLGPKLLFASAELTAEVKAKVEASLGMTVGTKETVTKKITVDGNKTRKLKVIWYQRYRKGVATSPDGKEEPLLVCIGLRMRLVKE